MEIRFGGSRHVAVGFVPQPCNLGVPIKKLMVIAWLVSSGTFAVADPVTTTPDPPARKTIPRVGPSGFRPSFDLDGVYLWLGPSGAGSHVDGDWDSTFGADAAIVRVRERDAIGTIGGSFGASRWTVRGGGRIWLDALIGSRVWGRMIGLSAGPLVELSELAHPKVGGSIGLWMFLGITPFARVGTVQDLGVFGEVGIHIALPVLRRR
jgi:hypothetical protein